MHQSLIYLLGIFLFVSVQTKAQEFALFQEDGKVGLKETTEGNILIPAQYERIGWSDRSFKVIEGKIGARLNEKWALLDTEGKHITPHQFQQLLPTSEKNIIASKKQNTSIIPQFGLIDLAGKTQIPFEYGQIESSTFGLIVSKKRPNRYEFGLLNEKGKEIIEIAYRKIEAVSDKYLAVSDFSGLSALFNHEGEALTDFSYDFINPQGDFLAIGQYNHQGLMNKELELIIPPLYKSLSFQGDEVISESFKQWDLFEEDQYLATFYFDDLDFVGQGRLLSEANNQSGLLNYEGDYIQYFRNDKVVASNAFVFVTQISQSGRYHLYSKDGKRLFRDSFEEINLYDQIIFAKRNQRDGHSWAIYDFEGKKKNLKNYQDYELTDDGFFIGKQFGKLGMISADGKELSPFLFNQIELKTEDRLVVRQNAKKGVINDRGNWVITPYYDSIAILDSHIYFEQGTNKGLADWYGDILLRTQDSISYLKNAIAISQEDSLYQLQSLRGEPLLDPLYDSIAALSDELLYLERDEKRFLYRPIDDIAFELENDVQKLEPIKNDYIPILKNGQWGFLDQKGLLMIANRYEAVGEFSEGLFSVKLLGKWGYVDQKEQIIIQPNYDQAFPFKQGTAIVRNGENFGLLNSEGTILLNVDYQEISRQKGYFLLKKLNQFGLATLNGQIIKNPSYDSIQPLEKGFFLVERNGLFGVVDSQGRDVIAPIYQKIIQESVHFLAQKKGQSEVFPLK